MDDPVIVAVTDLAIESWLAVPDTCNVPALSRAELEAPSRPTVRLPGSATPIKSIVFEVPETVRVIGTVRAALG